MSDTDTARALQVALARETRGHHLPQAVGTRAAERLGTGRRPGRHLAVAATLVGVLALAIGYAVVRSRTDSRVGTAAPTCANAVVTSPLPVWARAGFSHPGDPVAHVTSDANRIVAIPFVRLRVHQPAGTGNKVLWSAQVSSYAPLIIRARLAGRTVTRTVPGGPGPSYLDLPAAGCWHLDLRWGDQHDTMPMPVSP